MGVHHFKLSMLPRAYFERSGSPIPSVLNEVEIDRGEGADAGWWSSIQPSEQALARLRQLCPTNNTWGEAEEYVTSETWGSDLRIWWEHGRVWSVTFRFSPVADDRTLLDRFVSIARDEQCLLLHRQTGSLLEPVDEIVTERLQSSRAMRFILDPERAIIEAATETPQ
jgi:hypothetical protein